MLQSASKTPLCYLAALGFGRRLYKKRGFAPIILLVGEKEESVGKPKKSHDALFLKVVDFIRQGFGKLAGLGGIAFVEGSRFAATRSEPGATIVVEYRLPSSIERGTTFELSPLDEALVFFFWALSEALKVAGKYDKSVNSWRIARAVAKEAYRSGCTFFEIDSLIASTYKAEDRFRKGGFGTYEDFCAKRRA